MDAAATDYASSELGRQLLVDNERLQNLQKRFALATILVPFLGTLAALGLWLYRPIGATELALLVVMYFLTSLGVTAGFHRLFAHRSFHARPALRAALGILGSMAGQGTLIYWAATHRRHHQFAENAFDPHSPYVAEGGESQGFLRGLWHSHLGWMLESRMTNTARFAPDLIRDPLIARVSDLYFLWVMLGLLIPALIGGLVTASWIGVVTGFLWGGLVRLFLVHHMMWTSGSTAHMFGTTPFATPDRSTNNFLLAVPNLGEAWHNNHHAFPQAAVFGLRWWQVDLGGWSIRAFEKLGWASSVSRPSPESIAGRKKGARMEAAPAGSSPSSESA
jgi:stearoyl-CoA desaturase (delta-9 desaturase)